MYKIPFFCQSLLLALLIAVPLRGQGTEAVVSILLADGTQLIGVILSEHGDHIVVATSSGLEVKVPRAAIVARRSAGNPASAALTRTDPNYSRLMFAPTGRPLRQGTGYFSNYYVFFPGISYGISDRFSLRGGMSLVPGGGFDEQLLSLAPKFALYQSGELAFSIGALYLSVPNDGGGGMLFASGTRGGHDKSFTLGLGLGYIAEENEAINFAEHPVIVFGGSIRLRDTLALVSENWLITGENLNLSEQPFGLACRFFGENIAVDLGAIIIGDVIAQGFPIPWLSFAYHFGD